jgi:CRP/FNR family transcriptional regulator, cyclic AMP receptor protein
MMRSKPAARATRTSTQAGPRRSARRPRQTKGRPTLAAIAAIDWSGVSLQALEHAPAAIIFSQGDTAASVMYLETGEVRLSVVSQDGKEAVIAVLGAGTFFGEGCLAGQPRRMATATAIAASTILTIEKREMARQLQAQPELADRFLAHMLIRNIRIEEDLVDQLFNSSEKRLARTLLLLARYSDQDSLTRVMPRVSQELLAGMIGTTRSRVNFFMNKFRKLGFIDYNGGGFTIHGSLLSVVLHD